MALSAALRFDAGAELGMGHAHRCLALADALAARDCQVSMLTQTREAVQDLNPLHPLIELGDADLNERLEVAAEVELLILDYLDAPRTKLWKIRQDRPHATLVLIGNREQDGIADILIRQDLRPSSDHPDILNGGRHLLLSQQFSGPKTRQVRPEVSHAVVCLGGGRPRGLSNLIELIEQHAPDALTDVHVIGIGGARLRLENSQRNFTFEERTSCMAARMLEADIGFIAGGGLIHEAAATGLPVVYCPVVPHQDRLVSDATGLGLGIVAGRPETLDAHTFKNALLRLTKDVELRTRIHALGPAYVDGRGAGRVADFLISKCQSLRGLTDS